jgi:hypothetical protein
MRATSFALAFVLTLVVGCATTGTSAVTIPASAQPAWDRCRPTLVTWCHGVANGDPPHERECLEHSAREYVAASTEAARQQYLASHGCAP